MGRKRYNHSGKRNHHQNNKQIKHSSCIRNNEQKPEQVRKLFSSWAHELLLALEIRERTIAEDHMVVSCFISFIENAVKVAKFLVYPRSFDKNLTVKLAINQLYDYNMCDESAYKYLIKFYNLRNQLTHELVPYKVSQYAKLITKNKDNIENIIVQIEKDMSEFFKDKSFDCQ